MNKTVEVFSRELALIKDEQIKDFVIKVFDTLAPDYFWTCPTSTSGKYHPQVSLGEGGLVRHTKLAVWWGVELLRTQEPMREMHLFLDQVIAALLLHDLKKNGETLDGRGYPTLANTTKVHGLYLGQQIRTRMFPPDDPIPETLLPIIEGIETHMGVWTEGWAIMASPSWTSSDVRYWVHLADYCASRKVDDKAEELMR